MVNLILIILLLKLFRFELATVVSEVGIDLAPQLVIMTLHALNSHLFERFNLDV